LKEAKIAASEIAALVKLSKLKFVRRIPHDPEMASEVQVR
jgi:hypothetical protein